MRPLHTTKYLTIVLSALALCSTLVFLAGVSGLQYGCNNGFASAPLEASSGATIAAFGMSSTFASCGTVLRFYWFTFAFVCFSLVCILCATASRYGLHYARPFITNLVGICAILMMIASEAFTGYETVYNSFNLSYLWWHARFRAACAGAIMTVVWLILLLAAVGVDWEHNSGERMGDSKVAPTDVGVAPMPAGTAAAERV